MATSVIRRQSDRRFGNLFFSHDPVVCLVVPLLLVVADLLASYIPCPPSGEIGIQWLPFRKA
jgi:hypothetical protein